MTNDEMREALEKHCNGTMCEQCVFDEDKEAWCEKYTINATPRPVLEYCVGKLGGNPNEKVIHPTHYNQGKLECWDAMEAAFGKEAVMTFCKLNAFKYLWRADNKNGLEDIEKAINYLNKYNHMKSMEEVFGNESN